jgi:hypothetical protein
VTAAEADHRRRGDADGRHVRHPALDRQPADRVAHAGQEDERAAEELPRVARQVGREEQDDPGDPHDDADRAPAAERLVGVAARGEQRGEDRRAAHEDAGQAGGDLLLAPCDEQERAGHLDHREEPDDAPAPAHRRDGPGAPGERQQDRRAEHDAREDDERRGEVAEPDLDEQVRRAPGEGDEPHEEPGPA